MKKLIAALLISQTILAAPVTLTIQDLTQSVKIACATQDLIPALKNYSTGNDSFEITCIAKPSTPPPVTPPPTTAQEITILDGFERPEYALATDFKPQVARVVLKNQTTGFVIKSTNPCALLGTANLFKMFKSQVTTPSYEGGRTGNFYDALIPINATNCLTADYLYLDVTIPKAEPTGVKDIKIKDATITLNIKATVLPDKPTMPLYVHFSNSMMYLGWYGKYEQVEHRGVEFLRALAAHRIHPYGGMVVTPTITNNLLDLNFPTTALGYKTNSLDFDSHQTLWPNYGDSASLTAVESTAKSLGLESRSWFYTKDEPQESEIPTLKTYLQLQKTNAPSIKRMVTTSYRSDLDGLVSVWTPVAEHYCAKKWDNTSYPCESDYLNKGETWLYVSCMSHGCSTDRNGDLSAPKIAGTQTGAPDLVLDRTAAEPFNLYLLAHKYPSLKGLLYYNSVEQWKLFAQGSDMWKHDLFNFGGNLDGTLFWPGRPGIEGLTTYEPITSIRLKLLREASYLFDILALVPDKTWVKTHIDTLITIPISMKRDIKLIEKLRSDALSRLQ